MLDHYTILGRKKSIVRGYSFDVHGRKAREKFRVVKNSVLDLKKEQDINHQDLINQEN